MARPPAQTPAETPSAQWMRLYRAYRTGRGPKPLPRAQYLDIHAELAAMERQSRAEMDWIDLADCVLYENGITPDPDYPRDSIPPTLRRREGKPPDLMAALLGYERADDLLADAWKRWDALKAARTAAMAYRRRRQTR